MAVTCIQLTTWKSFPFKVREKKIGCYSNKSPTNALPGSFGDIKSGSDPDASYDFCKGKAESLDYKIFGVDDKNCLYGDN